jgi:outer membrane protein TolC
VRRIVFLVFSLCCAQAMATTHRLDLKKVVEFAVANSPELEGVRREMSIADMQRKNAHSVFLPQLDLAANYGLNDRNPQLAPALSRYSSDFGLYLTENLYDNGISFINYDSAKVTKKLADYNYNKERDRIALNIVSQFLNLSLVMRLYDVQKTQFDIIQKQFNSISNQYKQGVKTRRDYLRFKSELRRSEIQLQNSKTLVHNRKADLIKLLTSTADVLASDFEFVPEDVDTKIVKHVPTEKPNVEDHWIFKMVRMREEIFDNNITVSKRSYYPQVFLSGGVSYGSANYWKSGTSFKDNDFTSWNALLTVNFNLWDWGIRNRNISISQDRKVQQMKSLEVEMNEFIASNEKLMANMVLSHNNFLTAQELLDIESSAYSFLEGEYRNGRVSYLDLILGLRDLLNAKIQMFTSFYDLRTQLFQYKYHQGKLYEEFQ